MARFRGALVMLCAYSFLISGSLSTTVKLVNWNSPICFNGTIPDTTSCTTYYTCNNELMALLQAFFKWTKNTWWTSFNYTTGTCSLLSGAWETNFYISNSNSLTSIVPNLVTVVGGRRIRRKRQVTLQGVLAPLLSSLLSSGELTQKSTLSITCSGRCTGNVACFFDDLYHDCRIWDLLNPNRQAACGPLTTTVHPLSATTPDPPPTTPAGGVGATVPKTSAPATTPTTTPTTTTTTTAAAPGSTTIAVGDSCQYPDYAPLICDGCDYFFTCDSNNKVVTSPCAGGAYCVPGVVTSQCTGAGSAPPTC